MILFSFSKPYRRTEYFSGRKALCLYTFFQAMKGKGIEDTIVVACMTNWEIGFETFRLDVFSKVDEMQNECFDAVIRAAADFIRYVGNHLGQKIIYFFRLITMRGRICQNTYQFVGCGCAGNCE